MVYKTAANTRRVTEISKEETDAALAVKEAFGQFLKKLWAARQHDMRLVNVLKKNQEADTSDLYEIRHLLRRFQGEVKEAYTDLIFLFAGQKDKNMKVIRKGIIHLLRPLEKDTTIRTLKVTTIDAMQQLAEFIEEFLEAFEDFNDPDQVRKIINTSNKADSIVQSIENTIKHQLVPHFERNILGSKYASETRQRMTRRARLIKMLGE